MKKSIYVVILVLSLVLIMPVNTMAETLGSLRKDVANFTADLDSKNNQIAVNEAEIKKIKQKIADMEYKINEIEKESNVLQQQIDKANKDIQNKSEECKSLFQYLQISEGENEYLEYIFGASNISDMINRIAMVEQLTEYNKKVMDELTNLVKENEQRKDSLKKKKQEQQNLADLLVKEQDKINTETKSIKEAMPSIEQQKKEAQKQIEYYESIGCSETEDLNACQRRYESKNSAYGIGGNIMPPSANGFFRPMENGYVTQNWMNNGHLGIDLSNSNKTIEIHPVATGVVFAKYKDSAGALVLKIRHNYNGRYLYSTYAHLSAWYVNVGDIVSPSDVIGRMGNTGYSTGAHLHLEITTCDWHAGGGCTWSTYQKSTINPRQYIGFPNSMYTWWYGR